jgi:hypothetical protein
MALGFGKMGLRPADFWAMSLPEWLGACDGFAEFHGAKPGGDMPTMEEIQAAIEADEARNNVNSR